MWLSLLGLAVTLGCNILWVPTFGYMGCAYAALTCYGVMMVASYIAGRINYPIGYDLRRLGLYFFLAVAIYFFGRLTATPLKWVNMTLGTIYIAAYLLTVCRMERVNFFSLLPINISNRFNKKASRTKQ